MTGVGGGNANTLIIGGAFIAIVLFIAWVRNREADRLTRIVGKENLLMSAFNVYYHGLESEKGSPLRSIGALALTVEGLYYRALVRKRELFIPGKRISSITVINEFKGKNMYEYIVGINFVNDEGKRDRAGFKIPHPERWSAAIRKAFPDAVN